MGILVNKNNGIQTPATATPSTSSANPIVIQMPPFQYPYSFFNSYSDILTHPIPSSITSCELPSISEFLLSLDQKYNCNNIYSKFENTFLEEEITVNAIKNLSNE